MGNSMQPYSHDAMFSNSNAYYSYANQAAKLLQALLNASPVGYVVERLERRPEWVEITFLVPAGMLGWAGVATETVRIAQEALEQLDVHQLEHLIEQVQAIQSMEADVSELTPQERRWGFLDEEERSSE